MRNILKITAGLLLVSGLSVVLILFLAIDKTPLDRIHRGLTPADIKRAKQLLDNRNDPNQTVRELILGEKDLNIAANYLLNRFNTATAQVRFNGNDLNIQIAIDLPPNIWGSYLDFSFSLRQHANALQITALKIGQLPIADFLSAWVINLLASHSAFADYHRLFKQQVERVQLARGQLRVVYAATLPQALKRLALHADKPIASLAVYQYKLVQVIAQHNPAWRLSLAELLQPLFALAYQRSTDETAQRENYAVIFAVNSYMYRYQFRRYWPAGLRLTRTYPVYAYQRTDLAQHFVTSALLAAAGTASLGDLVGEDKEIGDATAGSGFSFADLAADRAGVRFGQMAVADAAQARRLQRVMAQAQDYQAFVPDVRDLPEKMNSEQFAKNYGSVQSPAYLAMLSKIDQRIETLPVFQMP